ncbi:MAG: nucleoside triphosphate pyrophosphohydrolase [bacterium]|nr:nucleoside triphosphate pyrophosphohydrolase [bacterium]
MSDLRSIVFDREVAPFERLKALMELLRSENGCAWDRKQTHESLMPYLIEETYEVIEAIKGREDTALCEELGDLVLQVVFHAQIAKERGAFETNEVVESIVKKLVKRHPHVFEESYDLSPEEVRDQWENIKVDSGEKQGVLNGLPSSMPALLMAFRVGEKAGGVGFDWKRPEDVLEKLREELREIEAACQSEDRALVEDEIGDLLFATVSLARKYEIDPEQSLKKALDKFRDRFSLMEQKVREARKSFKEYTLDELEEIWQQVKKH